MKSLSTHSLCLRAIHCSSNSNGINFGLSPLGSKSFISHSSPPVLATASLLSHVRKHRACSDLPNTHEFNRNILHKGLFESGCQVKPCLIRPLEELVHERNLFMIVFGKESNLRGISIRFDACQCVNAFACTLNSMSPSAQAVYTPRENPNMQILSPSR